jgi:hypothetical protein
LSSLESEAAEKSASYREQLRAALLEMQAQQTREMGTGMQASLQGLLESLRVKIQSTEEQCVEETQKQLAAVRETTLSSLESEAAEKSASYREQLRAALLEVQAQQTKEMETGIQASFEGLLESLRIGSREWEEQAKTELEAHSRQLVELFEKRLEALSATARERQLSEAEAFRGVFQSWLSQAARLLEGLATDAGHAKAPVREESAEPPSRPPQPSTEPSRPAFEDLLEKQRRIIKDAFGALRSRLSQTLASPTPKG